MGETYAGVAGDVNAIYWNPAGLGRVLGNVSEKIFLAERADGKTRELRLLLNREPPRRKAE